MYDSVQDGIGGGGVLRQQVVPVGHGNLTYEDCGGATVSVFDELHEVEHLLGVEAAHTEIIDDEQTGGAHLVEETGKVPGYTLKGDFLEEFLKSEVTDTQPHVAGVVSEGGGKIALARARCPGDDDRHPPGGCTRMWQGS